MANHHVLIVEDDPDLAEAMSTILEVNGITTAVAYNGREALAAVARDMPSVIVLDMLMPIMNGWDFAREFDATYRRAAPILVVTAAENARARAKEIAADDVLSKPFDAKILVARVRAMMEAARRAHP